MQILSQDANPQDDLRNEMRLGFVAWLDTVGKCAESDFESRAFIRIESLTAE